MHLKLYVQLLMHLLQENINGENINGENLMHLKLYVQLLKLYLKYVQRLL